MPRVTDSPAGGTPSQPNTELVANIKREGFLANMPAQVEGGLISDITTGREVEIQPPPPPQATLTSVSRNVLHLMHTVKPFTSQWKR
jgi:hypothetical protein